MTKTDRERLVELLRERSFERKRVVLASGRESDFFIDCKQTILTAEGHVLVGSLMFDALEALPSCEAVAGVELGGYATLLLMTPRASGGQARAWRSAQALARSSAGAIGRSPDRSAPRAAR